MIKGAHFVILLGAAHLHRTVRVDPTNETSNEEMSEAAGTCFEAGRTLRSLGVVPHLISAAGGDDADGVLDRALADAGISDGRIVWLDRTSPSQTTYRNASGNADRHHSDLSIHDRLTPRVLSRRHVRLAMERADAWIVDASLPEATLLHLATRAARPLLIAASQMGVDNTRLRSILSLADAVVISRIAASMICESDADLTDDRLNKAISNLGPTNVIIQDGRSASILDSGRLVGHPIVTADATEGAIAGSLVAALLASGSFAESARTALSSI